jgi:hypothetical protein
MKQIPRFIYATKVTPNLTPNTIYRVNILEPPITTITDDNGKTMIVNLDKPDSNGIRWIMSKFSGGAS